MTECLKPFKKCFKTIKRQILASNSLRNPSLTNSLTRINQHEELLRRLIARFLSRNTAKRGHKSCHNYDRIFLITQRKKNNDLLGEVQIQFFESFIARNVVILRGQTFKEFLICSLSLGRIVCEEIDARISNTKNFATIAVGKL